MSRSVDRDGYVIKNRRLLQWAERVWRSQNELIKAVMEQNPSGERPLGRPKTRWKDLVSKRMWSHWVEARIGKKEQIDREGWRNGCEMGWSREAF